MPQFQREVVWGCGPPGARAHPPGMSDTQTHRCMANGHFQKTQDKSIYKVQWFLFTSNGLNQEKCY